MMQVNESFYYDKTKLQKKRYLENCKFEEPTRVVIDKWFRASAKIEEQEGTDLANFNRIQVINLFKSFNSKSRLTLASVSLYFSDYYNWCMVEGLVDQSNFTNQYDTKRVKSIIEEIIPVEMILNKIFTKNDIIESYLEKVLDPVNKFTMYAPFCGIYGEEATDLINLTMNDIDEEKKVAHLLSGKEIRIDDLFIELAKSADAAKEYAPEGVNTVNNANRGERYVYDESYYILKSCDTGKINVPISYKVLSTKYRMIQKQTGNKFLNGNNLYKSGLLNYIKEQFENQHGISFKKALFDKKGRKEYTYAKELQEYINEFGSNMTVRMLRLRFGEFVDLYE